METLNHLLFLALNAPAHPSAPALLWATVFAEYAIWLVPAFLAGGWLWGGPRQRVAILSAAAAVLLGLGINQLIGLAWDHPRPFVIGLGHTYLAHAADSSFPSDHLTLLWAVAISALHYHGTRPAAAMLAWLGLPVAWARIYLGVHFPFDMAGALCVAFAAATLARRLAHWYVAPAYRCTLGLYRRVCGPLIARGWVLA